MKKYSYKFRLKYKTEKNSFIASAHVEHRDNQPAHCNIASSNICIYHCLPKFKQPCIKFCPAGVYESGKDNSITVNSLNCLHCKTCINKCPFDNILWNLPEGGGGPKYDIS